MPFKRPSFLPGSERRAASKAERVAGWEARLAAQKQRYEERQARYERASRLSSLTLRCSQDAWPLIAKLIGGPSAQPKDLEVQPKDLGVGLIEVDLSGTYAVNLLGAAHILKGRASRGRPELGRLHPLLCAALDQIDLDAPESALPVIVLIDLTETPAED